MRTWHRLLHRIGHLVDKQPLWAVPLVLGVGAIAALGVGAVRLLVFDPQVGVSHSWAADMAGVSFASAAALGSLWWVGRAREERHGNDE